MLAKRAWTAVALVCEAACGLCLLLIAAATLFEVVSRYVFDSPTIWAQDTSIYLMIWCAFLGLLPTDRAGQHIRIDVWYKRLPLRAQSLLERAGYGGILAFTLIAAWSGGRVLLQSIRLNRHSVSLFSVPMWIPQSALVVGMALFAMECLHRMLQGGAAPSPPGTRRGMDPRR